MSLEPPFEEPIPDLLSETPWLAFAMHVVPEECFSALPDALLGGLLKAVARAMRDQLLGAANLAEQCLIRRDIDRPDRDQVPYARRCIAESIRNMARTGRMEL